MRWHLDWRVKGTAQKILAHLPGGRRLNSALQSAVGGLRDFDTIVDVKIHRDWLVLIDHMRQLGFALTERTFLEIGTGRYPALPVAFVLGGAAGGLTYDIHPLLHWGLTRRMLARFERHLPVLAARLGQPESQVRERWSELARARRLTDFLRVARIDYRAPADAAATGLPPGSVDVVFSNSVLEHVQRETIGGLMRETRRVLRTGGLAIHSVNCGDHYAYFDPRLTPIHYLRFGERQWRRWNNRLQYQNRLRANDFLELAEREGLEIVLDRQQPRPELLARFEELPIAPEFAHYSREQLCTTSVDFVARAK